IPGIDRGGQRAMPSVQFLIEARISSIPYLLERKSLERDTHRIDFAHVLDREVGDVRAGVRDGDEEAFLDQLADGLAQRSTTDAELFCEAGFNDLCARSDIAIEDGIAQAFDDVGAKRTFRHAPDT